MEKEYKPHYAWFGFNMFVSFLGLFLFYAMWSSINDMREACSISEKDFKISEEELIKKGYSTKSKHIETPSEELWEGN